MACKRGQEIVRQTKAPEPGVHITGSGYFD